MKKLLTILFLLFVSLNYSQEKETEKKPYQLRCFDKGFSLNNNGGVLHDVLINSRISFCTIQQVRLKNSYIYSIIRGSTFAKPVMIEQTDFLEEGLEDSVFEDTVSFHGSKFYVDNFNKLTFLKGVNFKRTKFYGDQESKSNINFTSSEFKKGVDFEYAIFEDDVHFESTVFKNKADFSHATFQKKVSFYKAKMPDTLIFDNVKASEIIDLTQARFHSDKKHYISLNNAPIENIRLLYTNFTLLVPDKIEDLSTFERTNNVYGTLLKNLKERGYMSSYEILDKEYHRFKFLKEPKDSWVEKIPGYVLNAFNYAWNDYGYAKSRIWFITGFFFVLFYISNLFRLKYFIFDVYPVKELKDSFHPAHLKSRLITGFFYTSLIFFGFNLKTDEFDYGKPLGVIYIIVQYLLGIVCLAYLADFVISDTLIGV